MLSKSQLKQYETDGYVIPDFKMPEYLLKKIEEKYKKLLKKHGAKIKFKQKMFKD